jgi:hypothetical protein
MFGIVVKSSWNSVFGAVCLALLFPSIVLARCIHGFERCLGSCDAVDAAVILRW